MAQLTKKMRAKDARVIFSPPPPLSFVYSAKPADNEEHIRLTGSVSPLTLAPARCCSAAERTRKEGGSARWLAGGRKEEAINQSSGCSGSDLESNTA